MQRLPEETSTDHRDVAAPPAGLGSGVLLALGLLWLAITMWTAHASILGNSGDPAVALGSAAGALPGVIAASLLAGGTAGLALIGRFGRSGGTVRRLLVGLAAGSVCGLVAAGAILYGYGANSSIAVLAVTVGIAGAVGGASAALPSPVFAAGIVATLVVFLRRSVVQPRATAADQPVRHGQHAAVAGVGERGVRLHAVRRERAAGRDRRVLVPAPPRRTPLALVPAGRALPGLLLLATEALTHLGGSSLFGIVKGFSAWDRAMVEFTDFARFRNALVVLFVGGLTAMIAVGRTLSRPSSDEASSDEVD
jgi:hypothetical protein